MTAPGHWARVLGEPTVKKFPMRHSTSLACLLLRNYACHALCNGHVILNMAICIGKFDQLTSRVKFLDS